MRDDWQDEIFLSIQAQDFIEEIRDMQKKENNQNS